MVYMYVESDKVSIYPCSNRDLKYAEDSKLITEKNLRSVYNVADNSNYLSPNTVGINYYNGEYIIQSGVYIIRGYSFKLNSNISLQSLIQTGVTNYIYLKLVGYRDNCLTELDYPSTDNEQDPDRAGKYGGCVVTVLTTQETDENKLKDMLYLGYINVGASSNIFDKTKFNISNSFEVGLNIDENLSNIGSQVDSADLDKVYIPFNDWLQTDLIFDDGEI